MTRWAVFFDRDGVLTEATVRDGKPASPRSEGEMVILPSASAAVRRAKEAGALTFVVTNQPDIARGKMSEEQLRRMHARLEDELDVDGVYVCPHDGVTGCDCRKPRPGLLRTAADQHDVDLAESWLIGDRWVDVAAGAAAGVRTILLERPYSWDPTSSDQPPAGLRPTCTCADLDEAVRAATRGTDLPGRSS